MLWLFRLIYGFIWTLSSDNYIYRCIGTKPEAVPADTVSFELCIHSYLRASCVHSDRVCRLYSFIINVLLWFEYRWSHSLQILLHVRNNLYKFGPVVLNAFSVIWVIYFFFVIHTTEFTSFTTFSIPRKLITVPCLFLLDAHNLVY